MVPAAWRVISPCGSGADGSSTDAYRYSTGYGCTTVNAAAIDATAINACTMNAAVITTSAMNAAAIAASISEGVS
jgi:hypothetical protein